jgi:two-component system, OmpR family, response regulator MprA
MNTQSPVLLTSPITRAGILLVDDDPAVRVSLSRALESENYRVRTAGDRVEALANLNQGGVDVALLDVNLPLMEGWEVLHQMTSNFPLLPVIVITARPSQMDEAAAAGAAAILEKPLALPALLELIERLTREPEESRLARIGRHDPIVLAHMS